MNVLLKVEMVHSEAVVAGFEGVEIATRSRHNSQSCIWHWGEEAPLRLFCAPSVLIFKFKYLIGMTDDAR